MLQSPEQVRRKREAVEEEDLDIATPEQVVDSEDDMDRARERIRQFGHDSPESRHRQNLSFYRGEDYDYEHWESELKATQGSWEREFATNVTEISKNMTDEIEYWDRQWHETELELERRIADIEHREMELLNISIALNEKEFELNKKIIFLDMMYEKQRHVFDTKINAEGHQKFATNAATRSGGEDNIGAFAMRVYSWICLFLPSLQMCRKEETN